MSTDNHGLSRCWFCNEREVDGEAGAEVKMWRNPSYSPWEQGGAVRTRRVQFETSRVLVPRCERCKVAHELTRRLSIGGRILGLLFGIVGGGIVAVYFRLIPFAFGALLVLVTPAGWLLMLLLQKGGDLCGRALGGISSSVKKIKPQQYGSEYSGVQKMVADNWSVGAKPTKKKR